MAPDDEPAHGRGTDLRVQRAAPPQRRDAVRRAGRVRAALLHAGAAAGDRRRLRGRPDGREPDRLRRDGRARPGDPAALLARRVRRPGPGDAGGDAGRLPVHVRGRRGAVLLGAGAGPRAGRRLARRGRRGRGRAPRRRGAPGRARHRDRRLRRRQHPGRHLRTVDPRPGRGEQLVAGRRSGCSAPSPCSPRWRSPGSSPSPGVRRPRRPARATTSAPSASWSATPTSCGCACSRSC